MVTTASTLLLVTRDKLGTAPSSIPLSFEPACVAVAPDGGAVAVGGADNKVRWLVGVEKTQSDHGGKRRTDAGAAHIHTD